MTTLTSCPVCNNQSFSPHLQVKDYTVSQETFQIVECTRCHFLITTPIPADLNPYYQSPQYISHSNKTNNLTDLLYKFARTLTLRWKTNLINRYNTEANKTLLDYGCGTGAFLYQASQSAWTIAGVEPAELPRETASRQNQIHIAANIDQLPPHKFAAITLWHVLEHIPDIETILRKLAARLEDNGTIFIAVPNHNSSDAKYYQQFWAAYDTPRHLWHFGKTDMAKLLQTHNLKIEAILPMKLDAYYVSILSEKYKQSNGTSSLSSLVRGLVKGFQSNLSAARSKEYSSLIYIARK
jgi:2-polyprenyl-3-methyl-5-hydroxy-6-metoxy-1,4-benzoquinol methylase